MSLHIHSHKPHSEGTGGVWSPEYLIIFSAVSGVHNHFLITFVLKQKTTPSHNDLCSWTLVKTELFRTKMACEKIHAAPILSKCHPGPPNYCVHHHIKLGDAGIIHHSVQLFNAKFLKDQFFPKHHRQLNKSHCC